MPVRDARVAGDSLNCVTMLTSLCHLTSLIAANFYVVIVYPAPRALKNLGTLDPSPTQCYVIIGTLQREVGG